VRLAARPFSDLDLLVHEPASLTLAQRAALRDAFEASELPFRVDLVALDELATGYRERVFGEAVGL
jgi:predicted nucleotidyltransferase